MTIVLRHSYPFWIWLMVSLLFFQKIVNQEVQIEQKGVLAAQLMSTHPP